VVGKTGKARLEAAMKRVFSAVLDYDGVRPEFVTLRQDDMEALLIVFKEKAMVLVTAPDMHPEQR